MVLRSSFVGLVSVSLLFLAGACGGGGSSASHVVEESAVRQSEASEVATDASALKAVPTSPTSDSHLPAEIELESYNAKPKISGTLSGISWREVLMPESGHGGRLQFAEGVSGALLVWRGDLAFRYDGRDFIPQPQLMRKALPGEGLLLGHWPYIRFAPLQDLSEDEANLAGPSSEFWDPHSKQWEKKRVEPQEKLASDCKEPEQAHGEGNRLRVVFKHSKSAKPTQQQKFSFSSKSQRTVSLESWTCSSGGTACGIVQMYVENDDDYETYPHLFCEDEDQYRLTALSHHSPRVFPAHGGGHWLHDGPFSSNGILLFRGGQGEWQEVPLPSLVSGNQLIHASFQVGPDGTLWLIQGSRIWRMERKAATRSRGSSSE